MVRDQRFLKLCCTVKSIHSSRCARNLKTSFVPKIGALLAALKIQNAQFINFTTNTRTHQRVGSANRQRIDYCCVIANDYV